MRKDGKLSNTVISNNREHYTMFGYCLGIFWLLCVSSTIKEVIIDHNKNNSDKYYDKYIVKIYLLKWWASCVS